MFIWGFAFAPFDFTSLNWAISSHSKVLLVSSMYGTPVVFFVPFHEKGACIDVVNVRPYFDDNYRGPEWPCKDLEAAVEAECD